MRQMKYYYTSLSKQFFLVILFLTIISRLCLFIEIKIFNIGEYSSYYNTPLSIIIYLFLASLCIFFLFAYKFCYSEFTIDSISYKNTLFKKNRMIDLNNITFVHITRRAIELYEDKLNKPILSIPLFKFGVISPNGYDSFIKLLNYKTISFENDNKVLPGYNLTYKFIRVAYIILSIIVAINAIQIYILVFMILFKEL